MTPVALKLVRGAEAGSTEPLARYTFREIGGIERQPAFDCGTDETLMEAMDRQGFETEPRFEVGTFGGPMGLRIYAREDGGEDDYLGIIISGTKVGPIIHIPSFIELWDLMSRFRDIAEIPTRACR